MLDDLTLFQCIKKHVHIQPQKNKYAIVFEKKKMKSPESKPLSNHFLLFYKILLYKLYD